MARQGGTTQQWRVLRKQAFQMYGTSCWVCGDTATEIDHILELDAGGADSIENLQPLCKGCHATKTALYNAQKATDKKTNRNGRFFVGSATPDTCPSLISPQKVYLLPPMAKES